MDHGPCSLVQIPFFRRQNLPEVGDITGSQPEGAQFGEFGIWRDPGEGGL